MADLQAPCWRCPHPGFILWFGPDVGAHARSAVGLAELPFDLPVEIEGEVEIAV